MVDKNIIAQRKKVYGDNLNCIADKFNEYIKKNHLGSEIMQHTLDGRDVCIMMSLMKECRREAIEANMADMVEWSPDWVMLKEGLTDTVTDYDNYRFIADEWEWYKAL